MIEKNNLTYLAPNIKKYVYNNDYKFGLAERPFKRNYDVYMKILKENKIFRPKISVLMPTYNTEKYLKEAIESILNQTFTDFELLVIDDCSKDNTRNIVLSYNDKRIRLIDGLQKGLAAALNFGIKIAKGEYVARMDADDIALPERFSKQVEFLDAHKDISVLGTWQERFGVRTGIHQTKANHEDIKAKLLFGCDMCHSTIMLRRSDLLKYDLFYNEQSPQEDFELWIRAIKKVKFANIPEVLSRYRTTADSISIAKKKELEQYEVSLIKKQLKENLKINLKPQEDDLVQRRYNPLTRRNQQEQDAYILAYKQLCKKIIKQNNKLKYYAPESLQEEVNVRLNERLIDRDKLQAMQFQKTEDLKKMIYVEKTKKHKIIHIFNLKIKIKLKYFAFLERLFSVKNIIHNNKKFKQLIFLGISFKKKLGYIAPQNVDFSKCSKPNKKNINLNQLDIAFIVPQPIKGSGGHRNIFRAIKYLHQFGHKLAVYYCQTNEDPSVIKKQVSEWFYDMEDIPFYCYNGKIGYHDVGVATWWKTAYYLDENRDKVKYAFYFVQDQESLFSSMGSNYILAENSYKLGFTHICSGPWCTEFLKKKFKAEANFFQFPVDKAIYNTNFTRTKKNKNIIFFAKPEMPRRCYEIGVEALKYFHQYCPDVEIILFGSNNVKKEDLPFPATCKGLLPTLYDLAELYRNADLGIVFSTTNPSLVPYEMMSCGCPVCDLELENALSKYGYEKNNIFLLNPLPKEMGKQLSLLIKKTDDLKQHSVSGCNFVSNNFPSELEMAKLVEFFIKEKISKGKI